MAVAAVLSAALVASLLALPAAAGTAPAAQAATAGLSAHAYLLPPTLTRG
jgi:hypothetical protein